MTEPTSDGLRQFRLRCVVPAPEEAREPWLALSRWIASNIPQSVLVDVGLKLWRDLNPINQSAEGTTEEVLADAIRDASDVIWYAMNEESIQIFERHARSVERLPAVP